MQSIKKVIGYKNDQTLLYWCLLTVTERNAVPSFSWKWNNFQTAFRRLCYLCLLRLKLLLLSEAVTALKSSSASHSTASSLDIAMSWTLLSLSLKSLYWICNKSKLFRHLPGFLHQLTMNLLVKLLQGRHRYLPQFPHCNSNHTYFSLQV